MKKIYAKIHRWLYKNIVCHNNSVKYGVKIGVNFCGRVKTYGHVDWGTEPWLITIGDNVHITDGVKFITHEGAVLPFQKDYPKLEFSDKITVGDNVYIGNNVLVLYGVSIGNNVTIGGGSIITKSIPDNSVVVGVPGRVIKSNTELLEKLLSKSSELGDLPAQKKDEALMKYHGYKGKTKGIYF